MISGEWSSSETIGIMLATLRVISYVILVTTMVVQGLYRKGLYKLQRFLFAASFFSLMVLIGDREQISAQQAIGLVIVINYTGMVFLLAFLSLAITIREFILVRAVRAGDLSKRDLLSEIPMGRENL